MKKILASILLSALLFSSCAATRTDVIDRTFRSLVKIDYKLDDTHVYTCTGFVINASRGYVITAEHCISENKEGMLVDGQPSVIVAENDTFAILTFPPMSKPPIDIRANKPDYGEDVISVGYGFGKLMVFVRQVAGFEGGDIALGGLLAPGMSGGPVVDMNGKVVGMNQSDYQMIIGIICSYDELNNFIKSVK